MAEQLVQQAIRNAAASQDVVMDLAPMTDFESANDVDDDALAADRDDDGDFLGENDASGAWLEDERLAYGDDWDGLADGDSDRQ